ncbi:hypothetical protein D8M20_09305 [Corynebacterium propinquum]|nr:hypothetical protein D8M24_09305 [Corynebacterium propinquum]RUP87937.1 hypothetical protein D8M40_09435 [Corynebacterium propinquum]RUP93097.1 hypothetical protein D8M20_09305 [Corynebacterium propinquum]
MQKIRNWPEIRIGILSLFDLKGEWTIRQMQKVMPAPKTGGNLNQTLTQGATRANGEITRFFSLK